MSITTDRRARRATITKLALAAVAVLGVGAALTSAAWTDDAWFTASATAGEVELEGRAVAVPPETELDWSEADDAGTAVVVPADRLEGLVPEEVRTFDIELRNSSSVPLYVTLATVDPAGALLEPASGTTVTTDWTDQELAVDGTVTVTVTVTAGDYPDALQGSTDGTLTLTFQGTTDLP